MVTKTYLPSNLSDISDNSDSRGSSVCNEGSDGSVQKNFFYRKKLLKKNVNKKKLKLWWNPKLKLWSNSKT